MSCGKRGVVTCIFWLEDPGYLYLVVRGGWLPVSCGKRRVVTCILW